MLVYRNEKGENVIEEDKNITYVRRFLKNSFHQSEFAEKFYFDEKKGKFPFLQKLCFKVLHWLECATFTDYYPAEFVINRLSAESLWTVIGDEYTKILTFSHPTHLFISPEFFSRLMGEDQAQYYFSYEAESSRLSFFLGMEIIVTPTVKDYFMVEIPKYQRRG